MQELVIKGINKVDEFTDPELLPLTTATRLDNLVLDSQLNKPVKRGGFSSFNANSAGGGIYSIEDLVDSAGNNQMIGVSASDGKSILKSAGGTAAWSSLKVMTTAIAKLKLATYNGKFYITNGTDTPFATDLTTNTDILLTTPSVSSVTAAHNSGGALTPNAKYYWAIAYITAEGEISPPSAWITHNFTTTSNNTTYTGSQSITLASLPVSSDSRVVGRLLYRTEADGLFPYLLTRLDNVSTTYTDEAADTLLDLSQTVRYGAVMNTAKYLVTHRERLFLGYINLTDAAPKMIRDGWISNGTSFNATANNTGELPAGTWKYRVCFVDKLGLVSGYLEATITLNGTTETGITLTNIPQPIGEGIEVKIYRSKKNVYASNTDFFFRSSNWGTTHTDIIADTGLGAGTLPAATTSTQGYSSGVLYSEIGKPSQIPSENLILVYPDDGDPIQGLLDDEDGVLIIKQNSICKIFTVGEPLNWQIHKLVSQIGCDEPLSIQKIGNRVYFLNNKQLYRYPDSVNTPVNNDLRTTLLTVTTINDSAYSNYYQWYVLIVTCNTTKYILIYNEKLDTWYKFSSALTWECVTEKLYGDSKGKLIFGETGANTLIKYDETVSLDTAAEITPYLKFKTFTSSEPNALFRLRKLWANYKKKDGQSVYHTFSNPDGNTNGTRAGVTTDYTTNKFAYPVHGFSNGDRVILSSIVATTGIDTTTIYFVVSATTNDFQLALTYGGSAVNLLVSDGSCTVTPYITNADTTNSTYASGYKSHKLVTDAMTPTKALTVTNKLIYQIDGAGLVEFDGAKIEYREVNRGQRV